MEVILGIFMCLCIFYNDVVASDKTESLDGASDTSPAMRLQNEVRDVRLQQSHVDWTERRHLPWFNVPKGQEQGDFSC